MHNELDHAIPSQFTWADASVVADLRDYYETKEDPDKLDLSTVHFVTAEVHRTIGFGGSKLLDSFIDRRST